MPIYFQNWKLIPNCDVHKHDTRNKHELYTYRVKHEFAKKCLRHNLPLILNNIPHIVKDKISTHSMQVFVKYIIYYNRIVKRVQYLTALLACKSVNEPSIIHCSRDALIFIPTFMYTHIYMSIQFCTHYIHKSTHSLTSAHYVYMQANIFNIILNRAKLVLVYIRRSIVAPLFGFLLTEGDYLFALLI